MTNTEPDALFLAMAREGLIEVSASEYQEALVKVRSQSVRQAEHLETMGPEEIA